MRPPCFRYLPVCIIFLFIVFTIPSSSQFNQLIFKKQLHFNNVAFTVRYNPVQPLGDQNHDGYDDFIVYDCLERKSYIFYGGNPVDTIADFIINEGRRNFNLLDINNDNENDLVFVTYDKHIKIYFGGLQLDTIADIVFSFPEGASSSFGASLTLKDFNGDGRSELLYQDPYLPGWEPSGLQYGSIYIYNTEGTFDTIPHYSLFGDSASQLVYTGFGIGSAGDINGDGLTDFKISGRENNIKFVSYCLGNSNMELTPAITFYQNEHIFEPTYFQIIKDINKDGKDDFIILDYGFYPYYFQEAILKGSFPIDTIPDWGLNTQNLGVTPTDIITAGDVNGDGFNDFMGAAGVVPPKLKLWLGGRNIHEVADKTWYGDYHNNFSCGYGAPGDVNGDGVDDIAIWDKYFLPAIDCGTANLYIFNGDTSLKADTIQSVTNESEIIPHGYLLNNPYPNPFNPNTIITWSMPQRNRVLLKVYDMLGNEITTLLNEEKPPGENKIEFDASNYKLTSGVYFLKLECYNKGVVTYRSTRKLSYLK